jgi:hypothetical protein
MGTLSKSEEKLFIRKLDWEAKLLPICEALKLSGFDVAIIADIMNQLQLETELPKKFSIVNNRYLVYRQGLVYDLHLAQVMPEEPNEPKKMAVIFWL